MSISKELYLSRKCVRIGAPINLCVWINVCVDKCVVIQRMTHNGALLWLVGESIRCVCHVLKWLTWLVD